MGEGKLCWTSHRRDITRYAISRILSPAPFSSARSVTPGIVIVLFFQCIEALLNPVNRKSGGVKWILVAHTVAMFLAATISLATGLNVEFLSYITGREFPGVGGLPSGPLGDQFLPQFILTETVSNVTSQINQWLADGLLVSFVQNSVTQVSNVTRLSSYIVVGSSTA